MARRKTKPNKIITQEPKTCPLCGKSKTEFQKHHVVWKMDGGSDDKINLIEICKTCHLTLTTGNIEDATPLNRAAFAYQMKEHGMDFLAQSNALEVDSLPFGKLLAEFIALSPDTDPELLNNAVKLSGLMAYEMSIKEIRG